MKLQTVFRLSVALAALSLSLSAQQIMTDWGVPAPPSLTNGVLNAIPPVCVSGSLYFATDQPAGSSIYVCDNAGKWGLVLSTGPSGALTFSNGVLDLTPNAVPRLAVANNFSGLATFTNGIRLAGTGAPPACTLDTRGLFWFVNNGSAKDSVQACVFDGNAYQWAKLY